MVALRHLLFDRSEDAHGVATLDAMASTPAAAHPAVLAEVDQVLDWAWRHFPHSHGRIDDGMDWDHDLQVTVEAGAWHTVSLTLVGSAPFMAAWEAAFGESLR